MCKIVIVFCGYSIFIINFATHFFLQSIHNIYINIKIKDEKSIFKLCDERGIIVKCSIV